MHDTSLKNDDISCPKLTNHTVDQSHSSWKDSGKVYSTSLKFHCQRRPFNQERLVNLARPKEPLKIPKKIKKRGSLLKWKLFDKGQTLGISKKMNLSYSLPPNKKEKQILFNSAKANVYGVPLDKIPLLSRSITDYTTPKTKNRMLARSSFYIHKLQKQNIKKNIDKQHVKIPKLSARDKSC